MLASATIGWAALAVAIVTHGVARATLLIVAVFALYRAALFIHEISHLNAGDVPAFRAAWNAAVGLPLLMPSFLYEGVHTDHHRQRCYATAADPEYIPFARRRPSLIGAYVLASLLLPLMLIARFGILAPLSWVFPPLRRFVVDHTSALVINHLYVRRAPIDRAASIEEVAATAIVWIFAGLWRAGLLPSAAVASWLIVAALASAVNAVRTLAAHLYDHDDEELSMTEQLLDSCTLTPGRGVVGMAGDGWRALWAPVGLRYHALHHWIPSLPYHNLGRAHRLLAARLAPESPYAATQHPAMAPLVVDLLRRARTHRRA